MRVAPKSRLVGRIDAFVCVCHVMNVMPQATRVYTWVHNMFPRLAFKVWSRFKHTKPFQSRPKPHCGFRLSIPCLPCLDLSEDWTQGKRDTTDKVQFNQVQCLACCIISCIILLCINLRENHGKSTPISYRGSCKFLRIYYTKSGNPRLVSCWVFTWRTWLVMPPVSPNHEPHPLPCRPQRQGGKARHRSIDKTHWEAAEARSRTTDSERKAVAGHRQEIQEWFCCCLGSGCAVSNLLNNRYSYQIREPLSHL